MPADQDVRGTLACFMALRLPLSVRIATVLETPGQAGPELPGEGWLSRWPDAGTTARSD